MSLFKFNQPHDSIIQMAYVTDNIQEKMESMSRELNIGPWFYFDNFPLNDLQCYGEPADFELSLALANSGM